MPIHAVDEPCELEEPLELDADPELLEGEEEVEDEDPASLPLGTAEPAPSPLEGRDSP